MNSILFGKYDDFTTDVSGELPLCINPDHYDVPSILRNYEYPVSSWPVVIDSATAEELNHLTTRLPQLLRLVPSLYFNNDIKRLADYYFKGDEMLGQIGLLCHNKNIEVGCRLDLTLTNDGFRVLEINMGTSIGGWQVQSFESVIRSLHAPLVKDTTAAAFTAPNTQRIYIRFLVSNIMKQLPALQGTMNVFIAIGNDLSAEDNENIRAFFDELLQKELADARLKGRTLLGEIASLKIKLNGDLYLGDVPIHSVLIFNPLTEVVTPDVFRSFLLGKIYLPDHLGTPMLGDKRNLSLLRAIAEKDLLDPADKALVLKHIPWTVPVEEGQVTFHGQTYDLRELIQREKDQLVIKAANGFQGKNVFVGKFLTTEEWNQALVLALDNGGFILQELSESLDFLAPAAANQWVPHKLIWGAFGYGNNYGGVWVRMSSRQTGQGVINSATGAVEAIVYESR
ncbi:hypothetical protein [Chitinophaga rhizophila]|uniref:Circularly permuted ATP-grasp superfamily protein n=1 Tax=Chitinophaga rhizophila TaxID=2866212 RepID=A0ABS7GHJ4_9BACT|nr:hypothetical protein [Chitinophaga rhizophila]MBW8687169.1 hypothetical protein [Chitinophaga rhizophila]